MARWRVYYGDGSTFSSAEGAEEDAPRAGVVAVVQENGQSGPLCIDGHDFYWLDEDGWYGGDQFGMWDYMIRTPGRPLVLFGRYVSTERFREVVDRARRDSLED